MPYLKPEIYIFHGGSSHVGFFRASRAFQVHQMRDRCDAADAEATLQRSIASTAKAATRDRNCRGWVIYFGGGIFLCMDWLMMYFFMYFVVDVCSIGMVFHPVVCGMILSHARHGFWSCENGRKWMHTAAWEWHAVLTARRSSIAGIYSLPTNVIRQ